jgi:hypothetical protein
MAQIALRHLRRTRQDSDQACHAAQCASLIAPTRDLGRTKQPIVTLAMNVMRTQIGQLLR